MTDMSKERALRVLCARIFGRNNLIGSDFADVSAWTVKQKFPQDPGGGMLIQFSISHHALGKIYDSEETVRAAEVLLGDESEGDS